ncbi:MAG: NPCBM/NEW2 domain-containing protein [Planctomycetales bacterium]|nr:NPCBM/NEW2 domain-containing protein [Planctomycetales bacterium]
MSRNFAQPLILALVVLASFRASSSAQQAHVVLRDGSAAQGELAAISGNRVQLQTADGMQEFTREQLQQIQFADSQADASLCLVALTDGSQWSAQTFLVQEKKFSITDSQQDFSEDTKHVRWVRFEPNKASREANSQWEDILAEKRSADVLVIRRQAGALDYIEGVAGDVTPESVRFQFDGDWLDAPRSKVEGLIYYRPNSDTAATPVCVVRCKSGSLLRAESLQLDQGKLVVQTLGKATFRLPMNSLSRLDFAAASTVYLSDLQPEQTDWKPAIPSPPIAEELAQLFGPRYDQAIDGKPLSLEINGERQSFEKGLSLHSRALLTYRLAGEYRTFQALVGMDPDYGRQGNVVITVSVDGVELYSGKLSGSQSPLELDLDVNGGKRMMLLVDFGEDLDVSDQVNFCNARLSK